MGSVCLDMKYFLLEFFSLIYLFNRQIVTQDSDQLH